MRREKPKFSRTGQFAGQNRLDKYWSEWGQRKAQSADQTKPSTIQIIGGVSGMCPCATRGLNCGAPRMAPCPRSHFDGR